MTTTWRRGVPLLHAREFEGHGAVFRNVDAGGDIILPGAFKRTLAEHARNGTMPPMFWMHDPKAVPGVWKSMEENATGLRVVGELVDTDLGTELRTLLQKQAVRGLSIGYVAKDVDFDRDGHRVLRDVDLWEVSIVSLALNPLAQVEAVKARLSRDGEYIPTERELEARLRDAGFSRKTAQIIIAKLGTEDTGGIPGRSWRDSSTADEDELREVLAALQQQCAAVKAATYELGGR